MSQLWLNKYFSDINRFGCFRVLQRNVRSYKRNFDELIIGIEDFNFKLHCIVVNETWPDSYDGVTQHTGKNVFRTYNRKKSKQDEYVFPKAVYILRQGFLNN